MALGPVGGLAHVEKLDLSGFETGAKLLHAELGQPAHLAGAGAPRHHPPGQPPDREVVADAEQLPHRRPQIGGRVQDECATAASSANTVPAQPANLRAA